MKFLQKQEKNNVNPGKYKKAIATHSSTLAWKIPWTAACQASLSTTISQSLLKFVSIESVMLTNQLILCHPFLL